MRVFIIASLTADGFIGLNSDHLSTDWTSKEDTMLFVKMSKQAGTVVMGYRTFLTINRPLTGRRLIVYTPKADDIKMEGVETTREEPQILVKRLEKEGVHNIVIAGGASIYKLFMDSGVVTELYLTIEPIIFGHGISLFSDKLPLTKLKLLETEKLNSNTILLHYEVINKTR
ncbi:MAG TPA: dihydrofolate reductase family protein [Candidatus Saccharimonadales bacterium]|jgi:dihydrofolate reductase|nr:dihydrofolate reductase family protein [Candidatus Saccharimonadales bacterium]